jgi:methionyl-tRNA formyltransferase
VGERSWRIAVISTVPPIAGYLVQALRELGHEPIAIISARREEPAEGPLVMSDATAPRGLDLLIARDKWSVEPFVRALEPDLTICWGYPWKIPLEALQLPRLGSINLHPAYLPRHRGPIPIAWAFRSGDGEFGATWHRMDAELDTGGILAQAKIPMHDDDWEIAVVGPRIAEAALQLLPGVLDRVAAGDPGDPQPAEGVTWAGHFGEDYQEVDWSRSAREIHDQVRAWAFTFNLRPIVGPFTELDGQRVRLTKTSLVDPGDGARRMETGDGPIWIVATESSPAEH